MSDTFQVFVPIDIRWQPSKSAADAAVALLWSMSSEADEITAEFSDRLQFQDPGGNWSGVCCPMCQTDLEDWFGKVMTGRWLPGIEDLDVVTPCCGKPTSLDVLQFGWPASFFRFRLIMMNSRVVLTDAQRDQLANCLGSKLNLIWQRI